MATLFDTHYTYIHATAEALAVETARSLGRPCDVADITQDLLAFLWDRVGLYDQHRGAPTTFIAMCLRTGVKAIVRHHARLKRRLNYVTSLPDYETEPDYEPEPEHLLEYIETLAEPARSICRRAYDGESLQRIGRDYALTAEAVREVIAEVLRPYAVETGWVRGEDGQGTPEAENPDLPRGK